MLEIIKEILIEEQQKHLNQKEEINGKIQAIKSKETESDIISLEQKLEKILIEINHLKM